MASEQQPEDSPAARIIAATVATSFSGPLPPPDFVERYEEVVPGAGARILTMAEQRAAHKNHLEIESAKRASRGLIAGTTVALAALAVALVAILSGEPIIGGVIAGADLVALVGVYVYGTRPHS